MLLGERGKGPEKGEAPSGRKQEGGKKRVSFLLLQEEQRKEGKKRVSWPWSQEPWHLVTQLGYR